MNTKNFILFGLTLVLGACAQGPMTTAKAKFQTDASRILNQYTRGISSYFPRQAGTRAAVGPTLSYSDQPYGGYVMRPVTQDVKDCLDWVQTIPETTQNYQFMVGAFSRCLNRVLSNRNPMMSAYTRALPGMAQWDASWTNAWRQQVPVDNFSSSYYNAYLPQMQNGYMSTQDIQYQPGF